MLSNFICFFFFFFFNDTATTEIYTLSLHDALPIYLEPGVFSERCTEKLPLRVDCIHRREFGEVSGHRVLIKRGPGNRGPTECGTTHEATSGMSSWDRPH